MKQLVELHGGTFTRPAAGRGQGATFTVALPVMAHEHPCRHDRPCAERPARTRRRATSPATAGIANLAGVKVLVVDDEPDARALVERLLEDCGATVTTAASAGEAMELVAGDGRTCCVSDIGMPDEDGYALIRRVRGLDGDRARIPAIALTAYARAEDRVKAISGRLPDAPRQTGGGQPRLIATVAALSKREHSRLGRRHPPRRLPARLPYLSPARPAPGKTTLAMQFLLEGVARGETCLYVTLSETRREIEKVARSHGWDLTGIQISELVPSEHNLSADAQLTVFNPSELELGETTEAMIAAAKRTAAAARPRLAVGAAARRAEPAALPPPDPRAQAVSSRAATARC